MELHSLVGSSCGVVLRHQETVGVGWCQRQPHFPWQPILQLRLQGGSAAQSILGVQSLHILRCIRLAYCMVCLQFILSLLLLKSLCCLEGSSYSYSLLVLPHVYSMQPFSLPWLQPCFAFVGEGFESVPELRMAKSLILDFFRGDVVDTLNVQVQPLCAGRAHQSLMLASVMYRRFA